MSKSLQTVGFDICPEVPIRAFSRVNIPSQFCAILNTLVDENSVVVDLGPGRGEVHADRADTCLAGLMNFRATVGKVIGLDVDDTVAFSQELARFVKPDGFVCARIANRWGYIGIGANLIPNRWYKIAFKVQQPSRKATGVFPTRCQTNNWNSTRCTYLDQTWKRSLYTVDVETSYFERSKFMWRLAHLHSGVHHPGAIPCF